MVNTDIRFLSVTITIAAIALLICTSFIAPVFGDTPAPTPTPSLSPSPTPTTPTPTTPPYIPPGGGGWVPPPATPTPTPTPSLTPAPYPTPPGPPPCRFYGTVTLNGIDVVDGTTITAVVDGDEYTTVTPAVYGSSTYAIKIAEPAGKNYEGKPVYFRVSSPFYSYGHMAGQIGIWEIGHNINLDLSAQTTIMQVYFLDVGQGDSILIDWGRTEVLIDGGRWGECINYIYPCLEGSLDAIVATHPIADHIGGLDEVLDTFVVDQIWLNGDAHTTQAYADFINKVSAEDAQGAEIHYAIRGEEIKIGGLTFEVLNPVSPFSSNKIENSIVLKLSFGQVDFLFTGNACLEAEAAMLAGSLIDDIDILKVGHHGSKYCSTPDFLAAAQPEIAIISVGSNPYGHPSPETIERLENNGATVFRTDVCGTVWVGTNGETYEVDCIPFAPTPYPTPTPPLFSPSPPPFSPPPPPFTPSPLVPPTPTPTLIPTPPFSPPPPPFTPSPLVPPTPTPTLIPTPTQSPPPIGYRDIPLNEGWNLISIPLVPDDSSVEAVTADISGNFTTIYGYDNSAKAWKGYVPGVGGLLSTMEECKGYWINMMEADTLTVWGVSATPPISYSDIPLSGGWNLISIPLVPDDSSVEAVTADISGNFTIIYGYDNSTKVWIGYVPGIGGLLSTMEECKGYWINMMEADNLTVSGTSALIYDPSGSGGEDGDYAFIKTSGGSRDVSAMSVQQTADGGYIVAGFASGPLIETPEPLVTPTLTPYPPPTLTPVPAPTLTPTPTLGPTLTPMPAPTLTPTPTLGPTLTPIPTPPLTPMPAPTLTPMPTPPLTPTPTLNPTPTLTPPPIEIYEYDALLLKYDSSGSLSWARTASVDNEDAIISVQQTTDGGFVLAGFTSSGWYWSDERDVLLLKYDSEGVLEWARTTGGSSQDIAFSVRQTADGGYIVAGSTESYGAVQTDILLLKYDSEGTLEWSRTAGGDSYEFAQSVQQTADGGYVVAGFAGSYGLAYDDVFLLKFDREGTLTWARTTGGNGEDIASSVQQTADGGYIVAGHTSSYGAGYRDALLLKYDSSGTLEWARTAGSSGSGSTAHSVQQTADGGYIVAGQTVVYQPELEVGILLLKFNGAGILEWARTAECGFFSSMQQTADGGYVVTGYSDYGAGDENVFLLKTDKEGNIPDCGLISSASPTVASPSLIALPHNVSTGSPVMSNDSPDVSTSSLTLTTDTICTGG
jgi:beta-lactamase superfamily II metal-dependent hydrolase